MRNSQKKLLPRAGRALRLAEGVARTATQQLGHKIKSQRLFIGFAGGQLIRLVSSLLGAGRLVGGGAVAF